MTHPRRTLLLSLSLALACLSLTCLSLAACDKTRPQAFAVEDAFVRATPQNVTAGYFAITNKTGQDDALASVTASWAGRAELHNTTETDGVMQMAAVESIALPADKIVTLSPGGLHVMLFDVKEPLAVGDTRKITLHFRHAAPQMVKIMVRPITYKGLDPHAGHH